MVTDSSDISRGWQTIPSNSDTNHTTTNEQSSPPAYSHTAANYFATPTYDAETSPVLTAAASRRMECSDSRYAFPSSLPSYIEMQDLGVGAGASACAGTPASRVPSVLLGPATQPKKQHGAFCRTVWTVLEIVGFAALAAAALGALYGIWRLIYWLAYKI
ncbi:hypothetical protein M436DRAFT_67202 [Aureobasidium namibiae CBS 147.97]|uniref:Uncharacterized protein n=1 Tax=Aureobasidium namibiae CBS 147.97 TaxID=1043004 RepID=A0A074W8Y1_9PEZI